MKINGISAGLTVTNPTTVNRHNIQTAVAVPLETGPVNAVQQGEASQPIVPQTDAVLQNEVLINEVLRNILFQSNQSQTGQIFETRSPLLTALTATQDLTPLQQNSLVVNEILRNLNFVSPEPANALLIDEIPPALEVAGISSQLNLVQENAQLVNQILQAFAPAATENTTDQIRPEAASVDATITTIADEPLGAPLPAAVPDEASPAVIGASTSRAPQEVNVTSPLVSITEPTAPVDIPIPRPDLMPENLALTQLQDRTPYVLAAYLINNPTPPPDTPEPKGREVQPVAPVAENRAVGTARFRQLLKSVRENRRTYEPESPAIRINVAQAEKSIRMNLDQVNVDMAAHQSPLHLVFARHGNQLALDIYDCSSNELCLLSYDVPIELDNLPGVLNNLQHQTGIIVNASS